MAFIPDEAVDRMSEISPGAWKLYCLLARYRNRKTGKCCPSAQTLARVMGVDRRHIFRLKGEMAERGWARFNGGNVIELFGFTGDKNVTTSDDISTTDENVTSDKNVTPESPKCHPPVLKMSPAYKEEPANRTNKHEPCTLQSESRFSFEQRKAYVKAVKDKKQVYSISGLARYLGNGDEDDQIAEWIETQELRAKLKAQGIVTDPEDYSMDDWITGCIERDDRAHLEMERKLIEERGGPKELWEHRVYEFLNAATESA